MAEMLKWLFTDYSGRTGRGMYCQPGAALAGLGLFENAVEFMGTDLPSVYRIVVFIIDANLFFNPFYSDASGGEGLYKG